jgi:transposase
MKITTIGIDLAKNVFQLHGVDERGKVVLRKQLRRDQMAIFFAKLQPVPSWHGGLRQRPSLGPQA